MDGGAAVHAGAVVECMQGPQIECYRIALAAPAFEVGRKGGDRTAVELRKAPLAVGRELDPRAPERAVRAGRAEASSIFEFAGNMLCEDLHVAVVAAELIRSSDVRYRVRFAGLVKAVGDGSQLPDILFDALIRIADQGEVGFAAVRSHGTPSPGVELFGAQAVRGGQDAAAAVVDHLDDKRTAPRRVWSVVEPGGNGGFHCVVL